MKDVEKHLEELGLSDKEVKVYLASLESGPATAQQLAAKAAVVRPTAYVAIGGLTKRGLMSSYTKGKKQYYQAEKPERLMRLLEDEKKKLADREAKLKTMLPGLESLVAMSGDKPEVKYYEGLEGLESLQAVLFEAKPKEVLNIVPSESVQATVPEEQRAVHNVRLKKSGITGKQIVIVANWEKYNYPEITTPNWELRILKREKFRFAGEISIFSNCVAIVSYEKIPFGILIRSQHVAETAKLLFQLAWESNKAGYLRK